MRRSGGPEQVIGRRLRGPFALRGPGKASNWLRTVPDNDYFVILRLYGPLEAAFDNGWNPGDVTTCEMSGPKGGQL